MEFIILFLMALIFFYGVYKIADPILDYLADVYATHVRRRARRKQFKQTTYIDHTKEKK